MGIIFITHFGTFGSKPFIIEAGELIKISCYFQSALREFMGRSHDTFTDFTELVEAFGLVERVL